PLYYTRCTIATDDHNEIYTIAGTMGKSLDGGENFKRFTNMVGGDNHDMWIDPTNGDRMIVGNDGVSVSTNRGESWLRPRLPIAQMYHVYTDNQIPYSVLGNRQDGPSYRGPSNNLTSGDIPIGAWHSVGGCESGFAIPDPVDNNIVWSGWYVGILERYDVRTGHARNVSVWPDNPESWPAADLKYRFQWTFPLHVSQHDNNTIFVTSQYVHRTTNGGQSWQVISPDLTTNDKTKQGISGGLTPDNIGVEYCCVIYAFDQSPVDPNVLWTGSNDGMVYVTRDGGQSWTNVTDNIPDLPPDGVVRNIDASKWDAAKAYIAIEHHQQGNFEPHVYKTANYGEDWEKIVDGIADSPLSYAREILEDPVRPGLVYLGTENALYVTFNDGDTWQPLMNNMPPAPMYDMVVQEHFNDLVVGTYGRGFWIMDDLSPLQQLTSDVASADAYLFEPRSAYRFHNITSSMSMSNDPTAGENPQYGASINYWLGSDQAGDVEIRVASESGETIRTLEG
ncbi:hypothetical protein LCGC14_2478830, partial [marine sediment metagenome]